jgi:small subunit ribosomal protein S20
MAGFPSRQHRRIFDMATKAAAKNKNVRTPSGRKRARQSIKANAANTALRSRFRTAVKSVRKAIAAGDHAKAMEIFKVNAPVLDSIADKNIFHKNTAARQKSRLNAAIKALAA